MEIKTEILAVLAAVTAQVRVLVAGMALVAMVVRGLVVVEVQVLEAVKEAEKKVLALVAEVAREEMVQAMALDPVVVEHRAKA